MLRIISLRPACGCPFRCASQTLCSGSTLLPLTLWATPNGGEGGIRTLGGVTPTHPFQGCTIGHSVTSPWESVEQINRSTEVNRNRTFKQLFA